MPNQTILTCYDTGLMTKEQIQQIRASMTPSLFAANYELKCIADENALFTNPEFTDDITSIYDGLCHIDAAYGGEDYTAFTIMKKTSEGIVAFGKLYHKHVNDCIPNSLNLSAKYPLSALRSHNQVPALYSCASANISGMQSLTCL